MRPFEINFDFPVASSNSKISIKATAEIHHSEPYFAVHDFYFLANSKKANGFHSVLPVQEVKRIFRDDSYLWVHKDSEQESELSIAIGSGIERVLTPDQLNKL